MTTASDNATLRGSGKWYADTGAADDSSLAATASERDKNRRGWQRIIDEKLIEWGRDPKQLEDDDLIPPSRDVISLASRLAIALRDQDCPPPSSVVPNGDGGIVLERSQGPEAVTYEVYDDGTVEYTLYNDCRVVSCERIL